MISVHAFQMIETNHLGRVVQYNPLTGESATVLDNLYLANGVALSKDESYLVISEMSICKLRK